MAVVDAGVIGNHDLDMGSARLAHSIAQDAGFPLLAANLIHDPPFAYPAALFVVKGVRVGLIGLTTPAQIKCNGDDLRIVDPVQTMHNLLPAIRPLCDVLIIMSHLGYSIETRSAEVQGAGDVELAKSLLPGAVDLIIGGHTHLALNRRGLEAANVVNGIPIVQAGALGQYLGEVTLTITGKTESHASGSAQEPPAVAVTDARLTNTDDLPLDNSFERNFVQPLVNALAPVFNQDLGTVEPHPDVTTEAIHNDFNSGESALANFISDGIVARCRHHGFAVDMAMIDRSIFCYGLPSGKRLIFRDWFNLMPSVVARSVVQTIIEHGLVPDMLLNVNIPNIPVQELRGYRVTRQGMRVYNSVLDRRLDPRGEPYYWIGGTVPSGIPDDGTDIGAISEDYVSITPLHLDLTEYRRTQQLSTLSWGELEPAQNNGCY